MKKDKLNVLLVEDDLWTRVTLRAMLQEMGVNEIYEAANGVEAGTFIKEAALMIDFIVCDWNMPKKNGLEFLQDLRKSYADLPFLMVTARGDINSVAEARDSGVNAYISKPFSYEVLEKRIEALLNKTSSPHQQPHQ